jgi:glycolate oxidase iron-sulfur subunit
METHFSLAQLADPATRESEKILRSCVHCGFCTATCPTYVLLGDELDSPRGRIYLIKDMLENEKPATKDVVTHIDRCLSCLSCMTTCPSGVHYMHLVDHARNYIEETYRRPLHDRAFRALLANLMPYRGRFRAALALGRIARPFKPVIDAVPGLGRLAAMLELVPSRADAATTSAPVPVATAERRGRVVMLTGCIQPEIRPGINDAARRLVTRLGYEVIEPADETCCGSLVHHLGRDREGLAMARHNIDVWTREVDSGGLDAIIITASGCGTTIKDYGFLFREEPAYAAKAARISALARDITEFLEPLYPVESGVENLTVAYHAACSLQHGQQVTTAPKALLSRAGFRVRDIAEGHLCCGSAGTYNILQAPIARRLRDRKVKNIEAVKPDIIATGNIGCMTQIGGATPIPIVHTVELLDWAYGGPKPAALARAEARAH